MAIGPYCPLYYSISLIKHINIKNVEEEASKVLPSRFHW